MREDAVQETLAAQATVISRDQLTALRVSPRSILGRLDRRQLYDAGLARGIFKGHAGPLTPEGRRWAGLLWAPENSWLGGASATATLGLERSRDSTVHLVTHNDSPRRKKAPGVRLERTELLPGDDLCVVGDLPCTAVARSLLDLAPDADPHRLGRLIAQAETLRIYDHLSMHRVIDERPRARGSKDYRAALAKIDEGSDRARSLFEAKTVALMATSPILPPMTQNAVIEGVEADIWQVGTRAVIECDGRQFHRTLAQILRDAERDVILMAAGYQILRLLWDQVVYHPDATLARVVAFCQANQEPPNPNRLRGVIHG